MLKLQRSTIIAIIIVIIFIFIVNLIVRKNREPVNVFFDLGANVGDSIENFLTIRTLGGGGDLRNKISSDKLNQKWTIYAVEGNSIFNDALYGLKYKIPDKHEFILLNGTIATTYDGYITFYIDKVNKNVNFWGSSIYKNHPDVVRSNLTKETKPCVDMARLLRQYRKEDYVVVKMDIEGAEFDLLLHLLKENVLGLIDVLFVEYHRAVSPFKTPYEVYNKLIKMYNVRLENWS